MLQLVATSWSAEGIFAQIDYVHYDASLRITRLGYARAIPGRETFDFKALDTDTLYFELWPTLSPRRRLWLLLFALKVLCREKIKAKQECAEYHLKDDSHDMCQMW